MNGQARAALRRIIAKEGSQAVAARRLRISPQYITDLLKNRRQPGSALLRRLGLRKIVSYEEVQR